MTTLAKLVVAGEADISGISRGLNATAREVEGFGRTVNRVSSNLKPLKIVGDVDKLKVDATKMRSLLKQTGGDLTAAAKLAVSENDKTAKSFNRVTESINKMRQAAAKAPDAALAARIGNADPFQRAAAGGFSVGTLGMRRAMGAGAGAAAGGFLGGSRRGQNALLAGTFTLANLGDAFAQGETNLTRFAGGLSNVMKTASSVAVFFGPKGWIAAGILATTSFMVDFFAKTRDEAEKTARALKASVDAMINTGDSGQILGRIQSLEMGQPSAGRSRFAANAFAGGITDLQSQKSKIEEAMRTANFITIQAYQKELTRLESQLKPLLDERARLTQAMLDPTSARPINGALPVTVSASGGDATSQLIQSSQSLIGFWKQLSLTEQQSYEVAVRILNTYDSLNAALATMDDHWTDQALTIRGIINDLKSADDAVARLVENLAKSGIPKVGLTPSATPPMSPVSPPIANVSSTPTFGMKAMVALGPVITALGAGLQSLLSAVAPIALVFLALEPAMRALAPLLANLVAPIAGVAALIIQGLEPALRLMFPAIKLLGILLSILGEIVARVSSAIANVVGSMVRAVGNFIKKIPGLKSVGRGMVDFGNSLLRFADNAKDNAEALAQSRKRLQAMKWGDTADSISGLGEAARETTESLRQIPEVFGIALARWKAQGLGQRGTGVGDTDTGRGVTGRGIGTTDDGGGIGKVGGSEDPLIRAAGGGGGGDTYFTGPVYVQASDPEKLFAAVEDVKRRRGAATKGRVPSSWMTPSSSF